ncbi:MAG: hypothetical protein ACETVM_03905 [Candidatus Bathyarchaeia archaeon]
MLGRYENFPQVIHGIARFTFPSSKQQLQKAILEVAHQLNHEVYRVKDFTPFLTSNCRVSFEFGIAEDMTFSYLDKEELERFRKQIETKPLRIIDIFSVIRYRIINTKGKRTPLKFDYNMLRFAFSRKTMELLVSHERGNQRISLEDFITFLTNKINEKLKRETQKALVLKYSHSL